MGLLGDNPDKPKFEEFRDCRPQDLDLSHEQAKGLVISLAGLLCEMRESADRAIRKREEKHTEQIVEEAERLKADSDHALIEAAHYKTELGFLADAERRA